MLGRGTEKLGSSPFPKHRWLHWVLIRVNRCFKKRFLVSCGVDPVRQLWRMLLQIPLYYTQLKLPKNEALQRHRGRTETDIHGQDCLCSNTIRKISKQKVVGVSGTYISSQEWWRGDLPTWAVTWNGLNRKTKSNSAMPKMSPVKTPLRWLPARTFSLSVSPGILIPHSFTAISSFWLASKFPECENQVFVSQYDFPYWSQVIGLIQRSNVYSVV